MSSYFKPRRGKKASAIEKLTGNNVLGSGEIFFEVPDSGVGKGEGKIKMGDGTTSYQNLPYFLNLDDYLTSSKTFEPSSVGEDKTISNVITGLSSSGSVKDFKSYTKRGIELLNTSITELNNSFTSHKHEVADIEDLSYISEIHSYSPATGVNVFTGKYSNGDTFRFVQNSVYNVYTDLQNIPNYVQENDVMRSFWSKFSDYSDLSEDAINAETATYATNAGTSKYATNAGTSTYATNAGTSTYATNAGTSKYATAVNYLSNITKFYSGSLNRTSSTGSAGYNFTHSIGIPDSIFEISKPGSRFLIIFCEHLAFYIHIKTVYNNTVVYDYINIIFDQGEKYPDPIIATNIVQDFTNQYNTDVHFAKFTYNSVSESVDFSFTLKTDSGHPGIPNYGKFAHIIFMIY